jgi:hypothetical protein
MLMVQYSQRTVPDFSGADNNDTKFLAPKQYKHQKKSHHLTPLYKIRVESGSQYTHLPSPITTYLL